MNNSAVIIANAVREFWKQQGYAREVVVFFRQKYSDEAQWEHCQVLAMCDSIFDIEHVTFLYDFCEGQTDVANIHIQPLNVITDFYYNENYAQESEVQ